MKKSMNSNAVEKGINAVRWTELGLYVLFCSTSILVGCRNSSAVHSDGVPVIRIEAENSEEVIKSLKIGYQQFELNDSSQIGTIGCVEEFGDLIFVSSGENNSLLAFSSTGSFVSTIGSRGEGPGEYIDVTSFSIDSSNNTIYVYDEQQEKLICYDAKTFAFKDEHSYPGLLTNCGFHQGNSMIWFNQIYEGDESDSYFLVTDMDGRVENSFVEKLFKSGYLIGAEYPLYRLDDKIYGYTPFDMTVYTLSLSDANPRFRLSVGEFKNPTVDFLNKISSGGKSSSLFSALATSGYISSYNLYETSTTLCVSLRVDKTSYIGFYDKNTSKSMLMTRQELADKLGVGKIEYMTANRLGANVLAVMEPGSLIELSKSGYDFNDSLKAMIPTLKEEDNPILLKISF